MESNETDYITGQILQHITICLPIPFTLCIFFVLNGQVHSHKNVVTFKNTF